MIVLDASAAIELLLRPTASLLQRLLHRQESLAVPHLLDVEVAQVLRRYAARGELDDVRAREALEDLADLPLNRYPHDSLLPRVWELRHTLTAYDAVYIALAELMDCSLVTRDHRIAASCGHDARIEVI